MQVQRQRPFHRRAQQGNILMVTMAVGAVIGITLASYLKLVANQYQYTWRSQAWQSAIPLIEAGIEEALAHIHERQLNSSGDDSGDSSLETILSLGSDLSEDTATWEGDGWTLEGTYYVKQRSLGEAGYYVARISAAYPPEIIVEGHTPDPLKRGYLQPRVVRLDTAPDRYFTKGLVAKGNINMQGNNVRVDSFNSADDSFSTNGRYDPAKAKSNGDVATNSSIIDTLNVWNAKIFGAVATGPGGYVNIGKNGAVGDAQWHQDGNTGIQPGASSDDMNVFFPNVQEPFSGGYSVPTSDTVDGKTYTYVLGDGNYKMTALEMNSSQTMLVNGRAVLLVENDVKITGSAGIRIEEGARLLMYVKGADTFIGGNGVANENTSSLDFFYLGMPSNKSVSLQGNASFTGVIYAPQAQLKLGGGGNDNYDFVGASVSDEVQMNGNFNMHFDEALIEESPIRTYVAAGWNEIKYDKHGLYADLTGE